MSMSASSGPRAKCDQVVFEAIAKAAEIIVYARSPTPYQHQQGGTVSARFNLQIPEVAEIRQSLQHHRQSLHLPLRLEVYSAKSHQLLERWTLEYHTTLHLQQQQQQSQQNYGGNNNSNGDPIVQLRHVCKKVVIWLRTLYCWTRMLPSFGVRGPDLLYRLEVVSGEPSSQELPNFSHRVSPPVPTPYGRLVWKVWYAPHVQKPTTKPIPIAAQVRTTTPAIAMIAKSAPTRENYMLQQQNNNSYHQPSSFDRSGLLKKTHSNVEDHSDGYTRERPRLLEKSHSGNLSHRAALHDPPTYAYNATAPTTTTTSSHLPPLSSSPLMMAATPPPAFLSSTPPTLGFLLPPPNSNTSRGSNNNHNTTPPFSALPRELSQAEELCSLAAAADDAPPMHSLDLLHSSPFKTNAMAFSSALGESESWMLRSSTAVLPSSFLRQDHIDEEEEEDMPFAVDFDDNSSSIAGISSSMTQLAHQKKTVHRLQFLSEEKQEDDGMSALSQQLQDFKTFGASLAS